MYDLYAADTIEHPDGVSGVVDYSKITDANGQPIWHTTVLTNGGWDTDYLPTLQKDRLVASAKITDGKLAFANLYMGRYYLVERATGLVLPIDGNGKLYVTGKYPLLNKKLERAGKYSDLARKNSEYTDYIYKNQYSAVAESRKLNGSKAWDGYYLSYAKGYLCDEVNHYKTLSYADESAYHIHAEQESQDEVLKSGFSLQKLVSTTGQPSPALKLEGAGFTVYRIAKLSKAAQFKQNPDGSYDAASILSAYRKDNYDNATLKYDFTAEGQATANMYESSTETVNAYNATLTADGDYANGKGNGWMPTDQPAEYRLGEMFTNDEGIFRVEGLPYGQYLVVETTIPKDVFQCDPFIVTVNANSPQSRFTVPGGSVTTASNNYTTFNVLDEELEGYLQLIKTDTETGKAVKIANTAFALYRLDEKDRKTRISMIDPASGSATKKTDVFYTDADGLMKTPEKLPLGRYLIEELQGPEGYFNDPAYSSMSKDKALPDFDSDQMDQLSWMFWTAAWLQDARRIAKPGAPVCLFIDWRQLPAMTLALQWAGWTWRGVAVWDKVASRPQKGRFRQQSEYIVWGSNGKMPLERNVGCLPGVFRYPNPQNRIHVTEKPLQLMRDVVQICEPGGRILDPFAGAGTTVLAAVQEGYEAVGIEMSDAYFFRSTERLKTALESEVNQN